MDKSKAEILLDFLRQKDKDLKDEFNLQSILREFQTVKVGESGQTKYLFARAAVLMALGADSPNIFFAKEKFYDRINRFCRQANKVAIIVKKTHGQ